MKRRLLSILSSLLIFAGLLLPMAQVMAYDFSTNGWTLSSSPVTYDYDREKTIITYTISRGSAPHGLSHLSIETCHSSSVGATELTWANQDGSLSTNKVQIYAGPVFTYDAKSTEIGFAIEVEYDGLWETANEYVYLSAGDDIYRDSALTISCSRLTRGSFAISKTADPTSLKGGGKVTYTYTITNMSSRTLTVEKALDDKESGVEALFKNRTIAANGSLTEEYDVTFPVIVWSKNVIPSVTTNEWKVIVDDGMGDLPEQTATETVTNNPLDKVNLTFICHDTQNERLVWRARNPNPLDLAFTWYVNDNATVVPSSGTGTALAGTSETPTDTLFYTNLPTDPTKSINVGLAIDGFEQARKSSDPARLCTVEPDPSFYVTKTADPTSLKGGGTVTYTYTIINDGDVDLFVQEATDLLDGQPVSAIATLFPVDTEVKAGTQLSKERTVTFPAVAAGSEPVTKNNTFTVTMWNTDSTWSDVDSASAAVLLEPDDPNPGLQVTKTANRTSLVGSGNVTYTYTITNSGNVPIDIATASDDKIAEIDVADFFPEETAPFELAPGASATYSFTKRLVARATAYNEVNTFTVTAYPPGEEAEPLTDSDPATVRVSPESIIISSDNPSFTVSKSVSTTDDPATGQSNLTLTGGGTVFYFYTVNNTGDVPLVITEATDDRLGILSFSPSVINPGSRATASSRKSFTAPALGSDPQVETNVVSVSVSHSGELVGTKTASATVTNNPLPSGNITVRVFDNSPRNDGNPVAISGASVTLSNGLTGSTNDDGEFRFSNLPFGSYTAQGTAADPTTGLDPQTGSGSATLSTPGAEEVITILLAWTPALAPPTPPPPPVVETGSITVRVLDGSPRHNGAIRPIAGATVNLAGRSGETNAAGEITFEDLPFASYTALANAVDPLNPAGNERKSGSGQAEISRAFPHEQITIVLAWEPPLAQALSVTVTPGNVTGRICAPRPGGAQIIATDEAGNTVRTFVAATDRLGTWEPYRLDGLAPGPWTLTLSTPGEEPAMQRITVLAGETIEAADFTLACTGQPTRGMNLPLYYLTGGLMVAAGLLLRRYSLTLA